MPPPHPPSTAEWHTPPVVSQPPSPLPVLLLPAKFVIGFFYTLFLLLILACFSPFLLLFRFFKYIRDKLFLPRSCDLLWPRPPFNRAFLWLNRDVSLDSIKVIVNGQPPPPKILCFIPTPEPQVEVEEWDHEKTPLKTNGDFISYVKEKLKRTSYVAQVRRVNGFAKDVYGRSLLVIKTHPDSYQLCMARIVTALSQDNVTIEVEPRVYYECALDPDASCQKIRRGADAILKFIESFCIGPFNLSMLIQRKPEKVWRVLVADPDQVHTFNRRISLNGGYDDSETDHLTVATEAQLNDETTASFSITEICDVDNLQKAERLLRATMAELLTSFLAGALRKYFRESDPCVKHPPDCYAAFAVCSDKQSNCGSSHPCDQLLLPIQLPIGVEGMIPRLWSLQQQFAEHGKRCIPQALKTFNSIVRFIFPREFANRVANIFFKHTIVNVSFLRIHGDVMLDDTILTRFIPIPPLFLPSRASFVFVEHRGKIHLVSSIDRGLFDRHTDIFKYMKEDQKGLQDHLAFRLRTLTQTCVLPDRLPSEDVNVAPPEAPHNSPSAERVELLPGPSHRRGRRQSMAELSVLLREVQDELDEMRRNPKVEDREGTIKRLHDIEVKIEAFHNGMKSELWGNTSLRQEKDEAMLSVKELLAPYRRRVSVTGRKTSLKYSKEADSVRRPSASMVDGKEEIRNSEERRSSEEKKTEEEEVMVVDEERREESGGEERVEVHVEETKEDEKKEEMEEEKDEKKEEVEMNKEDKKVEQKKEEKKGEMKEEEKVETKEEDEKEEEKKEGEKKEMKEDEQWK